MLWRDLLTRLYDGNAVIAGAGASLGTSARNCYAELLYFKAASLTAGS